MTKITKDFNKAVCEYMMVTTKLAKADIGFVFGNAECAEDLAVQAAKLYKKGYFKKVILSGGSVVSDISEAQRMCKIMTDMGIPKEDLILEDKATNTGENVTLGMDLLDKEIGLNNIQTVIIVGQIEASRRFIMTMEKHWPDVTKMFCTCNRYGISRKKWHEHEYLMETVKNEYYKIEPYKKKGFIDDIDIVAINSKVENLPKPGKYNSRKSAI